MRAQGFPRSPQQAGLDNLPAESKRPGNPLVPACRLQYLKGAFSQIVVSPVRGVGGRKKLAKSVAGAGVEPATLALSAPRSYPLS